MGILEWLLTVGIVAAIGYLTYISLRITSWVASLAIQGLVALVRKIKEFAIYIRRRGKLKAFLKAAQDVGEPELVNTFKEMISQDQGLGIPLDKNGQENWNAQPQIIAPESNETDMPDGILVSDTGKYRFLK